MVADTHMEAFEVRSSLMREVWGYRVMVSDMRTEAALARRPPVTRLDMQQGEIYCRPEQHVWLEVPKSWRCQCGKLIIEDSYERR